MNAVYPFQKSPRCSATSKRTPIPRRADGSSPFIGTFQGRAVYLLHAADAIGVASANAGNVLTASVLKTLPLAEEDFSGPRGCGAPL